MRESDANIQVTGMDNFVRPGSERNRANLRRAGVEVRHGDVRNRSDFEGLGKADWVIDCAANPSVLAGADGKTSTRQLVEHNLQGTVNILEYCRRVGAGFVLISTSRVYSINELSSLAMTVRNEAFELDVSRPMPAGASARGISPEFPTTAPVSLYGSTKLASEILALEYGEMFDLPVWINRCGVLAGAGQFGTSEQGIFSFWIHAYARKRPLRYMGFHGHGHQVRDAFHPDDLAALIRAQMKAERSGSDRIFNLGGGPENAMSLAQLTAWCSEKFGKYEVDEDPSPRRFDIPWMIMDYSRATEVFGWRPQRHLGATLEELARHAEENPNWLELTCGI
jgi:CDP-paratose 2-epimerase